MSIWKRELDFSLLNNRGEDTLVQQLGMEVVAVDDGSLSMSMPVDHRTHQPLGLLHGGASVALAESVGSLAANLCVDYDHYCVGVEINANHLRAKRSGVVTGKASPLHLGGTTQVWQIEIRDEKERLVCMSRLTMAVRKHKGKV
ncbi:PaaI family thioesterase [Ferrimonas gelatinilytica]|uniref:Hotdog fold thioesterase n=1 Tax=Ferrimonas gelatinilytica TaxID=1255257 RepID=A0ABP9SET6_9GAMM